MRSHLGCTGSVSLGVLGPETQERLEHVAASWLEYSPDSRSLVVRHVQPDDVPPLREIAGELLDFLHAASSSERAQIPGGALYYQDEPAGQYIRLKVWPGGTLAVTWARPEYRQAQWQPFQNQPVNIVFEPFQRLNGKLTFECHPNAADDLRRIFDKIAGDYSQGDYAITSTIGHVNLTLTDVNADGLVVVNALRYMAKVGTLNGEIDVSSFRAGDMEDYCRFAFRNGEICMARPALWPDSPEAPAPAVGAMTQAA